MAWVHYQPFEIGEAMAVTQGMISTMHYRIGIVATGRQRVFRGYFVELASPDGTVTVGEDPYSLRAALEAANDRLAAFGTTLRAAGLDPRFYESGLSENSGRGYIDGMQGAVRIMEPISRAR